VTTTPPFSPWRAGGRLAWYRKAIYFSGGALWSMVGFLPALSGLALKGAFDRIAPGNASHHSAVALLAVFVGVEMARALCFAGGMMLWPYWWRVVEAWMRANLLESVVCAPDAVAHRLPASAGDAVGRFRDDTEDLVWFTDVWVDVAGAALFTIVALAVMLSISPLVTVVVVLPLIGVVITTRALSHTIRLHHGTMRQSGTSVTGFVGDLFGGALALKAAGAEARAVARFGARNRERGAAAVRVQLFTDLLPAVSETTVDLGTGLVLLLAAPAMRRGAFSVGDLALFSSYLVQLTWLPRLIGRMLARHRQAGVALERMAVVDPGRRLDSVFRPNPIDLSRPVPPVAPVLRQGGDTLTALSARGIAVRYGDATALEGVDLDVPAGSFTVVVGAVGAGKTTLVRGLLGLVPLASGTIAWNDEVVTEPGAVLVPPRVAYVAQEPRVFSAAIDENVRLGVPIGDDELWSALVAAQVADDVRGFPHGVATRIGARGSRLSGGQAQRTTIARAIVRTPELLVLDDVTSALDAGTESRLWAALAASAPACLVVSNRRAALAHADRIVVLERGRVAGAGPLDELLDECAEFRRLWQSELLGG